ncbi:MAPEG domain containing protein [Lysobacter dokdonensis DS-58]|uniref:MAPEG domain containing protein n=1 Tax=Lysobacter dokdonensis DS-58 TaxID=1300345 RepID=A0A0A2WKQ2_9GAMM|nr:MAPEG family protein [Lysobacter dokdonensis]KGQ20398.1 MAPEG domain containing protein [Lysobacter dokdonensis DS-58]
MVDAEILKPAFALVGLTVVVFLRMYWLRLSEIRRGRIDAQAVATSAEMARLLSDTRAADNFRNLFELPVLFYAAVFVAVTIGRADHVSLILAWAFVVLRIAHSAVHCTYNRVMHRFALYAAGAAVLFAWWGYLAAGIAW